MNYRAVAPSAGMPPGIRCIWMLRGDAGPAVPQRVVPDGCVELVLNVADRFRVVRENGATELQPAALIVADATRPITIAPSGRVDILAIRFEPGFASAFLGAPMHELGGRSWSLDDVRPAHRGLLERIADADGAPARIRAVESLLGRAWDARLAPDDYVSGAARIVATSAGRLSMDAVAEAAGVGSRRLQRGFQRHLGFGPKFFARLTRFQSLLGALGDRHEGWSRLAAGHGYYDQSHLIRDFHDFTGTTPEDFLGAPSAMAELFAGG